MRWQKLVRRLVATAPLAACSPSSVADAEAKKDVRWLENKGTPEAIAALGRMADSSPQALTALKARSEFDVNSFIAAWAAAKRNQAWGPELLRQGLSNPARADSAASAMGRGDALLVGFVSDIEPALSRLAAGLQGTNLASLLASVGPAATPAIERRLKDGASRGAMCRGLLSKDASREAKNALLSVGPEGRDHPDCVLTVSRLAIEEDSVMSWLASSAEPGLLTIVGKNPDMPCARMHSVWEKALATREPSTCAALTVPLGGAILRCAETMDGVVADAILRRPGMRGCVVLAIDPFAPETERLKASCEALKTVPRSNESAIVQERAKDAIANRCRGAP